MSDLSTSINGLLLAHMDAIEAFKAQRAEGGAGLKPLEDAIIALQDAQYLIEQATAPHSDRLLRPGLNRPTVVMGAIKDV